MGAIPMEFKISYLFMTVILLTFGLTGNILVIILVSSNFQMHTVTNIYLLCLSIVDVLHLISIIFVSSVIFMEEFVFGEILCRVYLTLEGVNWFAGTFLLTALSIDRYVAICHPVRANVWRTTKVTFVIVLVIFAICLVLLSPLTIYAHFTEKNTTNSQCFLSIPNENRNQFVVSMFSIGFAMPVLIMAVFYTLIVLKLRDINRNSTVVSSSRRKSMKTITRFVFVLVLIYVTLWFPYWINQLTLIQGQVSYRTRFYMSFATQLLGYVNSALNPLWYAFMSKDFRILYLNIMGCDSRRLTP